MLIDPLLLWMLTDTLQCSATDVAASLYSYFNKCIECPPNIKRNTRGKIGFRCWVLRGFYPNTSIMFKMTIAENECDTGHFIKVSLPAPKHVSKMKHFTKHKIEQSLDNILLDNVQQEKQPHTPKCMTPKGMKPLKRSKHVR